MRINDVKLAFAIADRDIEQCAVIKIIAVIEVRGVVRKITRPKTWMRHRCNQAPIRVKKPGDFQQSVQASLATRKAHPDCIECYDIKYA